MIVDYHMHLAPDGDDLAAFLEPDRVRLLAQAAAERGVDEICVTEHVYRFARAAGLLDHPYWDAHARADLDAYLDVLAAVDDGPVPVLAGLEVDWLRGRREALAALLDELDLDLVLGSVHWLDGLAVDHPDYAIWDAVPVGEAYRRYFAALRDAAGSGLYDVLAHADLAKVFGHRPPAGPPLGEYEDTADAIAAAGVAVEISTAGLHKPAGELYPAPPFLHALARRGVPITLASDAHRPEHVGRDLDAALRAAYDAGYRSVSVFRARERRQEPLG